MYIVIVGNPCDGFSMFGPFNDPSDANDWADGNVKNESWWVTAVAPPEEF